MAKKRLDVLLFEKGLCPSRERAKTAISLHLTIYAPIRRTSPSGLRRWNFGGGTSAKSLFSIYSSRVNGTLRLPASSLRGLFGTSNSSH